MNHYLVRTIIYDPVGDWELYWQFPPTPLMLLMQLGMRLSDSLIADLVTIENGIIMKIQVLDALRVSKF